MTFSSAVLLRNLRRLSDHAGAARRYVVAFSGGLDSTVLLHALVAASDRHDTPVLAAHIDHGLQDQSAQWASRAKGFATEIGVEFVCLRVAVDRKSGRGLEAAAREARYATLEGLMEPGDWLLSAHHQDDQTETLLLNLLRGSGPAGLAGIGEIRPIADGFLVRPLLDASRAELLVYAKDHALAWSEDPSNLDVKFDRNYLRCVVLPALQSRWPDAVSRLSRSARFASEASDLLTQLAVIDRAAIEQGTAGIRADRLPLDGLQALPSARQRNLLRAAIGELALPMPTEAQLRAVTEELMSAREDAQPVVRWPGVAVRRYRNQLYLLADAGSLSPGGEGRRIVAGELSLDAGLGVLRLEMGASRGLAEAVVRRGLTLQYRRGGEEFQPFGQAHTRKLKKLLQEDGIVPWMRDRIPLLYAGSELVAVADIWLANAAASEPGTAVRWSGRPALH